MRLDVFLSVSRLVKRRSAARELADGGAVRVGGQPAKASRQLRVGDEVEVRLGRRELRLRVAGLATRSLPRAEARNLYEILSERVHEEGPDEAGIPGALDFLKRP